MHPAIYTLFSEKAVKEWMPARSHYDDPLGVALCDVFVFFSYKKNTELRKVMEEMVREGFLKYREVLPEYDTDLVSLSDKGIDYIKTRLKFDKL